MKISGSKYFYNGEEQHAETKSINDVSICFNELKVKQSHYRPEQAQRVPVS
jgi:hypothetical protein